MYFLSVIIPVYNESNTIVEVIRRVINLKMDFKYEIIVINDGSSDDSYELMQTVQNNDLLLLNHETNCGKGSAINSGLKVAKGEFIAILDADLELLPEELPILVDIIKQEKADALFGSRVPSAKNFLHKFGNWGLNILATIFTRFRFYDIMSGWKIFKSKLLDDWEIESNRFDIEIELAMVIAKRAPKLITKDVYFSKREYGNSNISLKDGLFCGYTILKILFSKRYRKLENKRTTHLHIKNTVHSTN